MYEVLLKSSFFFALLGIVVGLALLRTPNRRAVGNALAIGCFFIALASCEYNSDAADRKDQQEAVSHGYKNVDDWKAARQQLVLITVQLEGIGQRRAAEERERLRQEERERMRHKQMKEEDRQLQEEQRCPTELKCIGEKLLSYATAYCPQYIERLAKNDFQWTDGWLNSRFSQYRWADRSHRTTSGPVRFAPGSSALTLEANITRHQVFPEPRRFSQAARC